MQSNIIDMINGENIVVTIQSDTAQVNHELYSHIVDYFKRPVASLNLPTMVVHTNVRERRLTPRNDFLMPILELLKDGSRTKRQLVDLLKDIMLLTDADYELSDNGTPKWEHDGVGWALFYMKGLGLVSHSERGKMYNITVRGQNFLESELLS